MKGIRLINKKYLTTIFKILFAVGLIYWLVQKGVLDVSQLIEKFTFGQFLIGLAICVGMVTAQGVRWWILLSRQEAAQLFGRVLRLTFLGTFFSFALPGGVGGDVVKGYYLVKGVKGRKMNPLMSIAMDRMVGFWAMSFMALLGVLFSSSLWSSHSELVPMGWGVVSVFSMFSIFFLMSILVPLRHFEGLFKLIFPEKMLSFVLRVYENIQAYSRKRTSLLLGFGCSLVSQTLAVVFTIWAASVMGYEGVAWYHFFFVIPLGFIAMALPLAPAGVGVGQAAVYFLFNLILGEESSLGPTVMTAFQFSLFVSSLPGGYFYLKMKPQIEELSHA